MKVIGYITDVGVRDSGDKSYPYVAVEDMRLSVSGDGLFEQILSLPRDREHTFVCKHSLLRTRNGNWMSDLRVVAVVPGG